MLRRSLEQEHLRCLDQLERQGLELALAVQGGNGRAHGAHAAIVERTPLRVRWAPSNSHPPASGALLLMLLLYNTGRME